jgi:hypothetical protein
MLDSTTHRRGDSILVVGAVQDACCLTLAGPSGHDHLLRSHFCDDLDVAYVNSRTNVLFRGFSHLFLGLKLEYDTITLCDGEANAAVKWKGKT